MRTDIKAYVEVLRKFKESERHLKWQRYAKACEHIMKVNPGKYKVRYSVDENAYKEDEYNFIELKSIAKYKDPSRPFGNVPKEYFDSYEILGWTDLLEQAKIK